MPEETYRLIFKGDLVEGYAPEIVKEKLSSALKLEGAKLDMLFSGKPVVIKKGATRQWCEDFSRKFEAAGARCIIKSDGQPTPPPTPTGGTPPPLPPPLPASATPTRRADERFCDACGAAVKINVLACPHCGKKFKSTQGMPGCAVAAIIAGIGLGAITVLGILAAIAIPTFMSYRTKAMETVVHASLSELASAQAEYYADNQYYTLRIEDLNLTVQNPDVQLMIVAADTDCFLATGTSDLMSSELWIDCEGNSGEEMKE